MDLLLSLLLLFPSEPPQPSEFHNAFMSLTSYLFFRFV
jgi:hypothetical protein